MDVDDSESKEPDTRQRTSSDIDSRQNCWLLLVQYSQIMLFEQFLHSVASNLRTENLSSETIQICI